MSASGMAEDGGAQMEKSTWKQRLVIGLLCLCVLSYTIYHIASLFGEDFSTIAAGVMTETDSISGHGYIFRDEEVLRSSHGGVVDYLCANGTKVTGSQALASIHEEGTSSDRRLMEQIDHQIAVLEESIDITLDNADYADQRNHVNDQYYMLTRMLASGQTGELSLQIDNMLVGLNRLIVTESEGKSSVVEQTLDALREQKQSMLEGSGEAVTEYLGAEQNGYFYTNVDGYETIFTEQAFASLSASSFFRLISSRPDALNTDDQTAYGKLAQTSNWGFVMEIPLEESAFFEEGGSYRLEFTENNGATLPMTLERMIGVAERSSVLLCLRCDRLPEDFDFHRTQSVRIETSSIRGLYVPAKALVYDEKDFTGVYILRGSVVQFRYVEILYEGSDYYLVAEDGGNDGAMTYLEANDLIILGGQNLFDGRILE